MQYDISEYNYIYSKRKTARVAGALANAIINKQLRFLRKTEVLFCCEIKIRQRHGKLYLLAMSVSARYSAISSKRKITRAYDALEKPYVYYIVLATTCFILS
jgi:hypothetical protein